MAIKIITVLLLVVLGVVYLPYTPNMSVVISAEPMVTRVVTPTPGPPPVE